MRKSKMWALMASLVLASLILTACAGQQVEVPVTVVVRETEQVEVVQTQVVRETQVVEVTQVVEATPEPVDRTGAWLDTVVIVEEPSADSAVSRLEVGDLDVYAFAISNAAVAQRISESPDLAVDRSFGSYSDLTFNPLPQLPNGSFNPFSSAAVREAMNWLIDRQYITQEIMGGLGVPRWLPFNQASSDYAALADVARQYEAMYAYNPERAEEVITAEMEAMGATRDGDTWTFEGQPVEISVLIRTEDERRDIGDYVANQLESIGFTVIRDYKTAAEAAPIWLNAGDFHIYTGGWVSTQVPRDLAGNFAAFYTDTGRADPLWQAYENDPEFYELAQSLANNEFASLEERREMLTRAIELSFKDSNRIWLADRMAVSPRRSEVQVAADLYSAVYGSSLWPYTLRRGDEPGGSMRIGMPSILTQPWNPIAGSNWIYDNFIFRGTGELAVNPDPFTGLNMPNRLERAEVFVQEGLPVGKTLDWVSLEFVPEIQVPEDAWVDWDPVAQRFLTVGEVFTEEVTALQRVVVYYPENMFETVKWHDGSNLSVGDFVMGMITTFDFGKEGSPVYDESQAAALELFQSHFKGVRILSEDPLVIESYTDNYNLDAESNFGILGPWDWWPYYGFGPGAWHNLTLGIMAEADGLVGHSTSKAAELEVDQLSYIAGPTLDIMQAQLDEVVASNEIPYAPTLGEYVTAEEAAQRYANLAEWRRTRGHFWLGTGAFYLERAFPVEGTVILQRNTAYPDPATKWLQFSTAPIAQVEIDGPSRVTIGDEAVVDVFVNFQGEPYPQADIQEVKYLVFDAEGNLATSGTAEAAADGQYQVTLSPEVTGELAAGSNRLEVIVVSRRVALPTFAELLFVTAP